MGGLNSSNLNKDSGYNMSRKSLLGGNANRVVKKIGEGAFQAKGAASDMYKEYKLMKSHNYKNIDDYHHCKANYDATSRGQVGKGTAVAMGNYKEGFDYLKNRARGLSYNEARDDYWHDLKVNEEGRNRAESGLYSSSKDACADYRDKNKSFPEEYW